MTLLNKETGLKRCPTCERDLLPAYFFKSSKSKDGFAGQCKECANLHKRNTPEVKKAYTYKRKALRESFDDGTVNSKTLKALFDAWTGICPLCSDSAKPSIDHIIPFDRGGANTLSNIWLICISCNVKKGTS